jgi:hypothetical protein
VEFPYEVALAHGMGILSVFPTFKNEQVMLMVELTDDVVSLLDYYDTPELGIVAAQHFRKCCKIAYYEGFTLIQDFFVHPNGCYVTVAEALAPEESPAVFRRTLRQLKAMSYVPCRINSFI